MNNSNTLFHIVLSKTLYCTLILPYINYGILIWGNSCKSYLDKLQKWATRTVLNSHFRSHAAPLFAKNNFPTITDTLELGVFMYKFYINDLPLAFNNHFKKTFSRLIQQDK